MAIIPNSPLWWLALRALWFAVLIERLIDSPTINTVCNILKRRRDMQRVNPRNAPNTAVSDREQGQRALWEALEG